MLPPSASRSSGWGSLPRVDLVAAIESFSDVSEYCRRQRRLRPDSGLIEQQRLFQKLRS